MYNMHCLKAIISKSISQRLFFRNFSKTSIHSSCKMGVLEVSVNKGVQIIKFNRPEKKNAITPEMYNEVTARLNNSAEDSSVAVTVLTGSGDFYSSGNDFSFATVSDPEAFVNEAAKVFQKFVAAFIDYPKLLIAVVNGPAIGIAATTLALCDIVYASDKAWFLTPFSRIGLIPEGCSSLTFPRIMGPAKASRLLYLNETLSVNEAHNCGFVTQIFPHADLVKETSTLIQKLVELPPEAQQLSKRLVRCWDKDLLHRVNQEESKILLQRFVSEEFFNAMITFNQKKSKL